jgi:hypothetical protein
MLSYLCWERRGQYGSTLTTPILGKIPHRDFIHFTGNQKPWEVKVMQFPKSLQEVQSSSDYWQVHVVSSGSVGCFRSKIIIQ